MRLLPLAEDVTRTMARSVSAMGQQLENSGSICGVYVQLCESVSCFSWVQLAITTVNEKNFRHLACRRTFQLTKRVMID